MSVEETVSPPVVEVESPAEVVDASFDVPPEAEVVVEAPPVEEPAPAPAPERPKAADVRFTPQDTVHALRKIRKEHLLEPDDDKETRAHVINLVGTWVAHTRAGVTTQDWHTWYTTPDDDTAEEEDEVEADPTGGGSTSV